MAHPAAGERAGCLSRGGREPEFNIDTSPSVITMASDGVQFNVAIDSVQPTDDAHVGRRPYER